MADLSTPRHDGELLHGQLRDNEKRIIRPYTQQIHNTKQGGQSTNIGNVHAEVTVVDANATEDKVFDDDAIDAALLAIFYVNETYVTLDLPDELISLSTTYGVNGGTGAGAAPGTGVSSGTNWSLSLSSSANAKSSAALVPDVQPQYKRNRGLKVVAKECYFYSSGDATMAQHITRINGAGIGVSSLVVWPLFHPEVHTLTMVGQSIGLTGNASAQQSIGHSAAGDSRTYTPGYEYSIESGLSIRSLDTNEALHRALVLTDTSESRTVSLTVSAGWTGQGADNWPDVVGGTTIPDQTVTATVSPTSFAATDPPNIPTSGWYLFDVRPAFSEGDIFLQLATVVDMAQLQLATRDFSYTDSSPTYSVFAGAIEPNAPTFNGGFPDTYVAHSGFSMPAGLTLNSSTGIWSGTPTTPGSGSTKIDATNSKGTVSVTIPWTITI